MNIHDGGNIAHDLRNVKEIVGNGECPYLISERMGNFSRDVIVYGYNPEDSVDNHVEYGEDEHGWEIPELDTDDLEQGNYYYAKGYFPVDLNEIQIKEVTEEEVEMFRLAEMDIDKQKSFEKE